MSQVKVPEAAFKSKLLDKVYHERLLSDLTQVVETAGVPAAAVWSRLSEYCTPEEVEWVRSLRSPADSGLVFTGDGFKVLVSDKMTTITGVCLRNYTDARVITVQDAVRRLKDDSMPTPTVLLIPNFCQEKANGGDMPSWEVTNLMGMLINRMNSGQKTILYVSSMATLQKQYGEAFRSLIEAKYSIATSGGVTAPAVFEHVEQE